MHVGANTVFILPEFKTPSDSVAVDCERAVDGFVVAAGVKQITPEAATEGTLNQPSRYGRFLGGGPLRCHT